MDTVERLFKLVSDFKPTGDQPEAIDAIVKGLEKGKDRLVLQGVTGSGKTFTIQRNTDGLEHERQNCKLVNDIGRHPSCIRDGRPMVNGP